MHWFSDHTLYLRALLAAMVAFLLTLLLLPVWRRYLCAKRLGQPVSRYTPAAHQAKSGTPTMGGLVVVLVTFLCTVLFGHWRSPILPLVCFALCAFAALGAYDDWAKIAAGNNRGLSAAVKYLVQSVIAVCIIAYVAVAYRHDPAFQHIWIPFVGACAWPLWALCGLSYCVVVGTTNAVNLTDGLDGLAMTVALIVIVGLLVLASRVVQPVLGVITHPFAVSDCAEIIIVLAALLGSGCAFLCFNAYPAQIFMGDTGALALGGTLGTVAMMLRVELLFFLMAIVFVIEACSVILQVAALRLSHRRFRFFRMAPIHHHFELMGWHEQQVVVRFAMLTVWMVLLAMLGADSLGLL